MNFQLLRSAAGKYSIPSASSDFLHFFGTPLDRISNDASEVLKYFDAEEASALIQSLEDSAKNLSHFDCTIRIRRRYSLHDPCRSLDIYAVPTLTDNGGVLWDGALADLDSEDALSKAKADSGEWNHFRAGTLRVRRDALTGLPNKTAILESLALYADSECSKSSHLVAIFIDLDNFGCINRSFGDHIGDRVLKDVAVRLESMLRAGDSIARESADKFLIIIKNLKDEAHCYNASIQIANRIRGALTPAFCADHETVVLTCSMGIAFATGRIAVRGTDILTLAEVAMYQAKASGKNTHYFFDKKLNQKQHSGSP